MLSLRLILCVGVISFSISCHHEKPISEGLSEVKFYIDPNTNSEDPEVRMAYGLNIIPPWADGGFVFVNLPEHLEYMPETMGIARHHDMRQNVWKISKDSTSANYSVESITEPGLLFSVNATSDKSRVRMEFRLTNNSEKTLISIRPLFCFQYHALSGFPEKLSDNFDRTFLIIDGKPVSVASLGVADTSAIARMAQVKSCQDAHNWWAEKMGGFIDQQIDVAYTILTAKHDDRKLILRWNPGKNFLSNAFIPCIHADPCMGNLSPGEETTVYGELVFTRIPMDQLLTEFPLAESW